MESLVDIQALGFAGNASAFDASAWVETSVGFGSTPVGESDTIVSAPGCLPTSVVEVQVVVDPAFPAEVDAHRHAALVWRISTIPDTDQFELNILSLAGLYYGFFTLRYRIT